MNRQIIKSNSALVVIGESPAWTTGQDTGTLFSLVQNCDMSIGFERQNLKQIGSYDLSVNDVVRAPEASVSFEYYLSPYMSNELLVGFLGSGAAYDAAIQSSLKTRNQNFYLIINPDDQKDGFDEFKRSDHSGANFSGFNAMTFGNCYLTKYSVGFAINSVPKASASFASSNVRFESITGNKLSVPAINSISGNDSGSGFLDLSGLYTTITGKYVADSRSEYNPSIALSNKASFALQSLQFGGANLATGAGPILQSFNLELDLGRTNQYGLGSNYVYGRKLEFPVKGSAQISCLVSGFSSGGFKSFLTGESGYSFEVSFSDKTSSATGYYKIDNAKIESLAYSMPVNGVLALNASFSFQATPTGGFYMKRTFTNQLWENVSDLWQNISVNWLDV